MRSLARVFGHRDRGARGCARRGRSAAFLLAIAATSIVAAWGCATTQGPPHEGTARDTPAEDRWFAPLPTLTGEERQRALLSLADIPEDPAAPAPAQQTDGAELPRQALRRIEEAQRLFAEQRYSETIAKLEQALRYNADSHEAHRLLALACLLSGNRDRAARSAERALGSKVDDLACHYVLARLAEEAGKTDDALREYRIALKCRSDAGSPAWQVLTHFHLGQLLLDKGDYCTAAIEQLRLFETHLQKLAKTDIDENPELATVARVRRADSAKRRAHAHAKLGQYSEAADALKTAVDQAPKDVDARREYIQMLVRAKRLDEASSEAGRFVDDNGGASGAVELLLAVHRFSGHPERGVAAIEGIVSRQPDHVELALLYARALVEAERVSEARQSLQRLLVRHPEAHEARWRLIDLHRSQGEWAAWAEELARLVAARPEEYVRAANELDRADAETAKRMVAAGLGEQRAEKSLWPGEPEGTDVAAALDYILGRLCDRLDRVEDAHRLFERAVERRPGFLPASVGVAEMYIERCQWSKAITTIEAARQSQDRPAHQTERLLGQAFEGLDDDEQAISHYQAALRANSKDVRSMMMLGRLFDRLGKREDAQRLYRSITAIDPDDMLAREALIRSLLLSVGAAAAQGDLHSEVRDMLRLAPQAPATQRCSAMIQFVFSPEHDQGAYLGALRELVRTHPGDTLSREELVARLFEFGQFEEAGAEAEKIVEQDPRSALANEFLARTLKRLLQLEAAGDRFEQMLQWYPNRQPWLRQYAELLTIVQNYDRAIEIWNRLLSLERDNNRPLFYRIRIMQVYRLAGRWDDARRLAGQWLGEADLEKGPRDLFRWFLLAADVGAEDHETYLNRCRTWLADDEKDAQVRGWLLGTWRYVSLDSSAESEGSPVLAAGQFARRAGLLAVQHFDEAIMLATKWLAEMPDNDDALLRLVDALESSRRYDEAAELARSRLSVISEPAARMQALDRLQQLYQRAERHDDAVATMKELLTEAGQLRNDVRFQRVPEAAAALEQYIFGYRQGLGRVLLEARRYDEAATHFKNTIMELDATMEEAEQAARTPAERRLLAEMKQAYPQRKAALLRMIAYVHQRESRLDLAEQRMREARGLTPDDIGVNNDLGYTLADAGKQLDEAERMIRLAVAEQPTTPAYLDSLGWVLYKKGEFEAARTWLRRAAHLPEGSDAVIWEHLGDAQWRLGDRDGAAATWKQSLSRHEEQVADGEAQKDPDFVARVKRKLEAIQRGDTPVVAPTAKESKAATRPADS